MSIRKLSTSVLMILYVLLKLILLLGPKFDNPGAMDTSLLNHFWKQFMSFSIN
jgi:hypothetical protein